MDVVKAVETYITKMVSVPSAMKVLLLDSHTTPIVSLASTQSTLLSHQVYLTDRIDNMKRDRMAHLKCVCFLRASEESLGALAAELREPKYGEYYLYFSNILSKAAIERLADVDEYEVVREVQEYFADYAPLLPSLFSLNHYPNATRPLYGANVDTWDPLALMQSVQGITAVLLSLKKKPVIRYERMSAMARKLAIEVNHVINSETALFDFRLSQVPPLLLIVDRRNDPVTPLLSQWTYQAMVHELIGIQNGRVDLSQAPDVRPELKEITLTPSTDPFFASNYMATFGDLGQTLKNYVESYQSRSQTIALASAGNSLASISDMKRFIEEYPEFRKLGGNVSKHVALVGELSRLVAKQRLLETGEVEQGLATGIGQDFKNVQALVSDPGLGFAYKIRVVMLYALRYQRSTANINTLVASLTAQGVPAEMTRLINVVLNIAGADQRQDDLFSNETIFAKGRSALKGLKGVENVYTQHAPHLSQTLEHLMKGRLKDTSYPFLDAQPAASTSGTSTPGGIVQKPQDVIIFVIGGTTYEEARTIALLNEEGTMAGTSASGTRFLLGGTCVHNSGTFLQMLDDAAGQFPSSVYQPPRETNANGGTGLSVQLGGINVTVGGAAGTGVYRSPEGAQPAVQVDGIRDGMRNLLGRVKQGVDRIGLP
ncbi:Sec1-like protein [Exidia glandulosa HHB12029]|uniref:Sec1-like protein n=1 Tax=Exidia glandulosa HHB12029 TaxID=1314781 RepID=A0A165NCC0_EXIGL|nr:Sec1-like protein [Exidia glandulosa HHB12029]